MATKRLLAAVLAATLGLTGCVSPYEDAIKAELADCKAGSSVSCNNVRQLQVQDQIWHSEKNQEVGNVLLGVLAVGLTAGAIAAASRPAPPPPPVFIPAPPIPLMPLPR